MNNHGRACGIPRVEGYDERVEALGYLAPQIAFGLMYEFVEPGQKILDIGIGTGLSSLLFCKAGLKIYGMDISNEMLDECKRKGLTAELIRHDLNETPYPYEASSMDHIISIGVLNHYNDLSKIFQQAGQILRKGGCFTFLVKKSSEEGVNEYLRKNEFACVRKVSIPALCHSPDREQDYNMIFVGKKI